jgi:hypothetical protein
MFGRPKRIIKSHITFGHIKPYYRSILRIRSGYLEPFKVIRQFIRVVYSSSSYLVKKVSAKIVV